jgi:hypothetical protein
MGLTRQIEKAKQEIDRCHNTLRFYPTGRHRLKKDWTKTWNEREPEPEPFGTSGFLRFESMFG